MSFVGKRNKELDETDRTCCQGEGRKMARARKIL